MAKQAAKEKPVDRRVQKTKKLLSEAMVSLVLQKGYDAVTIQDIIDKANVGRSTFYSHYESKEELLFNGQEELKKSLFGDETKSADERIDFYSLYEHARAQSQVAKAMLGKKGGDIIIRHIREVIAYKIWLRVKKSVKGKAELQMQKMASEAAAAAVVQLLTSWLEADMPFATQAMAEKSEQYLEALFQLNS